MNAFRHFAAPAAALCIAAGVIGCSSEPKAEQVPPGATLRVQGDQDLAFTAPNDGDVYVYDASSRTLLYSGHVEKGQSVMIDPEDDRITIDGKLALEKDIHAGNRHRIYFTPEADDAGRVVERTTEIRERPAAERVDSDTTIRSEETKRIETGVDGDTTIKKETTIKTD